MLDRDQHQAVCFQAGRAIATIEQRGTVDIAHIDHGHAVGQGNIEPVTGGSQGERFRLGSEGERRAGIHRFSLPQCVQAHCLQEAGAGRIGGEDVSPAPIVGYCGGQWRVLQHHAAVDLAVDGIDQMHRGAGPVQPEQPLRAVGTDGQHLVERLRRAGALHCQRTVGEHAGYQRHDVQGRLAGLCQPGAEAIAGQRQPGGVDPSVGTLVWRPGVCHADGEPAHAAIGGDGSKECAGSGFSQHYIGAQRTSQGATAYGGTGQRHGAGNIQHGQFRIGGGVTAYQHLQPRTGGAQCQRAHRFGEHSRR